MQPIRVEHVRIEATNGDNRLVFIWHILTQEDNRQNKLTATFIPGKNSVIQKHYSIYAGKCNAGNRRFCIMVANHLIRIVASAYIACPLNWLRYRWW
jgi:hypothetical protein